jgi:hypothetical protein
MTNGVITEGSQGNANFYSRKSWEGPDGKYESNGREKWNAYSMDLVQVSDQLGQQANVVNINCHPVTHIWTDADMFRLQSKLVGRIKGHQFNLAVDLAQANQLVRMCSNTIRSFGRSLLYLKRGNIAAAARELGVTNVGRNLKGKDISARWLEMQYGWLPAIGSCYEAAKAFEAISNGRKNRIVAKFSRKEVGDASCSPNPTWGYTAPCVLFAHGKIVCELEEELSFSRTLGLLDPLSVAWELTPFSFVFDWFLPIGTYLENLAIIPSLKGRFCTTIYSGYHSFYGTSLNPGYAGTKRVAHTIRVRRTVSSGLTAQLPTFVNPITAMTRKRIANAVSLAHQLFL